MPYALYGLDMHYVGKIHFARIRRGVINALVGIKPLANAFLTCIFLFAELCDPLIWVLISAGRCIRRLASICPDSAARVVRTASGYNGKTIFGPATSLARYLKVRDMNITENGWINCKNRLICNIFTQSTKHIMST